MTALLSIASPDRKHKWIRMDGVDGANECAQVESVQLFVVAELINKMNFN